MVAPASVEHVPAVATSRGSTVALAVFRLAGLFTFLTVTMGALVSATKSGAACPTWPGCRPGDIAPPLAMSPVVEFTHRVVAIAAGPLLLAAAVSAGRLARPDRWVRTLPWVALVGAIAAAAFGRRVVLEGMPAYLGAIDLFCALTALTAMSSATVLAARPAQTGPSDAEAAASRQIWRAWRIRPRTAWLGRTAAGGVSVLIVMHVTGVLVAGPGSYTSSMGWPLWQVIASDLHPWLQAVRLVLAGLAAVLVAVTAVLTAWTRVRAGGAAIAAALVAELLLGMAIRTNGLHTGVAAAHSALAVALLCGLVLLTTTTVSVDVDRAGRARTRSAWAGPPRRSEQPA